MKRLAYSAAILALATGSALAADLPSMKAPPYIPPPPPPMWTGFYVGLNAGYTWSNTNSISITSFPFARLAGAGPALYAANSALGASGISPARTDGFIGGGQIGYNWQFYNNFLVGVEADIQGVAGSGNRGTTFTAVGPFPFVGVAERVATIITTSKQLDYIGTVRGRLGWLFTPTLLLYGTGGLAYGGVSSSTNIAQFNNDCRVVPAVCISPAAFSGGTYSDTRVGWTAGGGLEWMFWPNWSAKAEYLYYDLGNVSYSAGVLATGGRTLFPGAIVAAVSSQTSTRYDGHIVRAGVNYHFNWGAPAPVMAKY